MVYKSNLLLNKVMLGIIGNKELSRKSQTYMNVLSSVQSFFENKNIVNTSER